MNDGTTFTDLLVLGVSFCAVAIAMGLLVNKYSPLVGFRATAVCLGALGAAGVAYLVYFEPVVTVIAPLSRKDPAMFRLAAAITGGLVFLAGALLLEKNYARLEERLKQKQSVVAVQAPAGPTADEIAVAVQRRLASQAGGPVTSGAALDRQVAIRSQEVLPKLTTLTTDGERIFRNIIGDPSQMAHLRAYQSELEKWRERVGRTYELELPGSGARELVLPKTGTLGMGPIAFELSRLVNAIEAQKRVIENLEKYVRRSLQEREKSS